MSLTDKQTCIITDTYKVEDAAGNLNAQVNMVITATAITGTTPPLAAFQQAAGWTQPYIENPVVTATTNSSAQYTLNLPSQADSDPPTLTWLLRRPDGAGWKGAVTAAMVTASQSTPLTVYALIHTYSWVAA